MSFMPASPIREKEILSGGSRRHVGGASGAVVSRGSGKVWAIAPT